MPIVITFSLAFCALNDGHVRVELITSKLPPRMQAILACLAAWLFSALFVLITWQTIIRGISLYKSGTRSIELSLLLYPFAFVVALGCGALTLVVLHDALQRLLTVMKK